MSEEVSRGTDKTLAERLEREELIRIAKVLEKQRQALDGNKLSLYVPHSNGPDGGQVAYHKAAATHKVRMVITGNRFGKTTAAVVDALQLALGMHPYLKLKLPVRIKMYADSFSAVMENVYLKVQEWIPKKYLSKKKPFEFNNQGQLTGVNLVTGSVIRIGSYDQDTRKSEGSNWHAIYFDEPPTRELYVANMRGAIDFGGIISITATPLSEAWMFDDLWTPGLNGDKPYIKCIRGTSDDNPHTDKDSLAIFVSELTEEEKRIRYHGEFTRLQGLVIDTYNPSLSDIDDFELNENFVIYEGIDPHPRKPNAVLWKAVSPEGLRFIVRSEKFDCGIYDLGQEISRVREELTAGGAVLVHSVADTSINQKDLGMKANQYDVLRRSLMDAGEDILPRLAKKRDWLLPGIQKLRDLYRPVKGINDIKSKNLDMSDKDITLCDSVKELFGDNAMPMQYVFKVGGRNYKYELNHYQWPDKALDQTKPIAKHNEFIDCDRYIESLAPRFKTPGTVLVHSGNSNAYRKKSIEVSSGKKRRAYQRV